MTHSLAEIAAQFRAAMESAGLATSAEIVADGTLHRFRVEGDKAGSLNGWYVLHADGIPAGEFGCWKRGIADTWRADIGRKLTQAEEAEHRHRIEAMREARRAETEKRRAEARKKASELWNKARKEVDAAHPYLQAKGVRAYGLRQLGKALLIPLRDARGHIHGLQFIQPDGAKRFGTGAAITGHYHPIAGADRDGLPAVLAVAEGYATAATIREATGWPVAVAFNSGNLKPVAEALRKSQPAARLLICADDDRNTEGNPGQCHAQAAAEAVGGMVAIPAFSDDDNGTDWNDWAAQHDLPATADALRAALAGIGERSEGGDTTPPGCTSASADRGALDEWPPDAPATEAPPPERAGPPAPHFELHADGVYWHDVKQHEGKLRELPPMFICSPLQVLAVTRDTEGGNWGRLVAFTDLDGIPQQWAMPARLLGGGRGDELRGALLAAGLPVIATEAAAQRKLIEYLMRTTPKERARCVSRTGWHGDAYVMPARTIGGSGGEVYHFERESAQASEFKTAGSIEHWRRDVSIPCGNHKRMVFALSCAFAGPLLHLVGGESGGFHLVGGSSSGKTTALRLASTVWGNPDEYWRQWRATDNGLEAIAEEHNDCLLALDEIGQADPRVVGEVAYMLANGRGKGRASVGGSARRVKQWRVMLLSTGELGTAAALNEAGRIARAGHEVRMVELPADAGRGYGMLDSTGDYPDAAQLADALLDGARRSHGHAGPAFVERLAADRIQHAQEARQAIKDFCEYVLPPNADGQVRRVAQRFGVVCAAGQLATEWRLTGWLRDAAESAAQEAFEAWINRRGGYRAQEPRAMVAAVRAFMEAHGGARFQDLDAGDNDEAERRVISRAGFRTQHYKGSASVTEIGRHIYFVLPEVFRKEVCAGYDYREVARVLRAQGLLIQQESGGDRLTIRHRLPLSSTPAMVYAIDAGRLFSMED